MIFLAGALAATCRQSIDDDFNVVPHLAVEREVVAQGDDLTVDTSPSKSLLDQVIEQIAILPFLAANQRCQYFEACPFRQLENAIQNLFACEPVDQAGRHQGDG